MKAPLLAFLALLCAGEGVRAQALPEFDQFPVTEVFTSKPAAPQIRTAGDRMFRTRIREGASKGPNFAGHLTIATWGCGTGCISIAIIDAQTGVIYKTPFSSLSWPAGLQFEGGPPRSGGRLEYLSFNIKSRLLVARGCQEEEACASFFYEWTGTRFRLIHKVAAVRVSKD